ncbi:MAG: uncharacterized protein H6Q37_162 [Chloroflexi bacterium]|nr:uncharacterized protein [Chloroflexota bacterium]
MSDQSGQDIRTEQHVGEPTGWAKPTPRIEVEQVPPGATNINIEGRKRSGALHGFGRLWQKTYRVRLEGAGKSPVEIMQIWKEKFADFQPPENHFYPPMTGIKPNDVLFISAKVPAFPGSPSILPISSGVTVLYVDDNQFTVMTPEGFPVSGWNTFSVQEDEDGAPVAQVQSLERSSDPIYEVFDRYFGSAAQQEKIWKTVLSNLAAHLGLKGEVTFDKVCVDPKVQWGAVKNVTKNAGAYTVLYVLGTPVRWFKSKVSK